MALRFYVPKYAISKACSGGFPALSLQGAISSHGIPKHYPLVPGKRTTQLASQLSSLVSSPHLVSASS